MRSLVIGYGSIGQRHARLLQELGSPTAILSRRPLAEVPAFSDLGEALRGHRPELVIVATETARHLADLTELAAADFRGSVLVEKPLLAAPAVLPAHHFADLRVAYNFRCHPLVERLRDALAGQRPIQIDSAVGQFLPDWRPGRDWQEGYSAKAALGGGVLRDLSHELDLLLWLAGPWRRVAALGGSSGALPIDSDDHWSILLEFAAGGSATLHLDYLNRPGRRQLVVETTEASLAVDLRAQTFTRNGEVQRIEAERDESYRRQLSAMLRGAPDRLCDMTGGLAVVNLVQAIEQAAATGTWVTR